MLRWPARLMVVGVAVLAIAALIPPGTGASAPPQAASLGVVDPAGYVGSHGCKPCHQGPYASWDQTLHVRMTKPIDEALVVGDFEPGASLEQYGRSYRMEKRDGRYFISVAMNGQPSEKYEIHYTLGASRLQGYLSKLPDGRIYVLPVFWHNETKRWIDYKEITPLPDDPNHELRQIWNINCVNCHATNLVRNFDVASRTFATTWTEMGIGCEACHGPGREHVALTMGWARDPASKPAYDKNARNPDLGRILKIFSTRFAPSRVAFDTCAYCHGNKNNSFFGFKAGDRYEDYALPFLVSDPLPPNDPQGDFWPDGRPSRFNRPQALMTTGCFRQGEATCTSCHTAHGSTHAHALKIAAEEEGQPATFHPRQSDALCTQCHVVGRDKPAAAAPQTTGRGDPLKAPATFPDLSAHTHHAPDSPGSRCIACHMSNVNWRLFTRRLDHTFQPPVPEMTAQYGAPNACTTCHEEKTPEWAAATMDGWYRNRERRAAVVTLADTMYRAGAHDTAVLPALATLVADRSNAAPVRASAAEFAGQLITRLRSGAASGQAEAVRPAVVNALIGAAADPEPLVRVMAVRALAATGLPRLAPVLGARLTDAARLVRASAAEGLLALGVTRLDGAAGETLMRAQDEWAQSLRTFSDVSSDHATLGWLEALRGRPEEGVRQLKEAIALDPSAARPRVLLGAVWARAGRYAEALDQFRTAKAIDPSYENLDRLIEEVRKNLK